jgi:outer membrane protein OmpA-like peptidoglycan-associated protein/tetratricopeptide (TPR) repeat protein
MKKTVIWGKSYFSTPGIPARALILLIALLLESAVYGQKILPSPQDLYIEAGEYMLAGDYQEALPVLLNLYERGYSGANVSYRIGECYLNLKGQKIKALPYLREASRGISGTYSGDSLREGTAPVKSLLYLGIAYRLHYDFDNALESFKRYSGYDAQEDPGHSLIRYHINRCLNAREMMASPAKIISDTLPASVNSGFSDFNPLVTADEKQLFYMEQLKFYDAIMHSIKSDTSWQKSENLTPLTGSDGDHLATGISRDGTELLLSAFDPYRNGEIYVAEKKDGQWNKMVKLNGNINTLYNETHASFSPDGRCLYFTSDRKGGYGGLDIYRAERIAGGDWGVAQNLGPVINTPYNEETPFVSGDGKTLFFSSQGHYNMGGYDVFMSALDKDGSWLSPVNIGYPVNTTDDDLFFFPLGSGTIAYQARFGPNSAQSELVRYNILSFGNPARFTVRGKTNIQADPGYDPGNISVFFLNKTGNDTVGIQKLGQDGSFLQKLPAGSFEIGLKEKDSVLLRTGLDIPVYFPQDELVLNTELIKKHKVIRRDTLMMKDILFAFDKSLLDESYLPFLDKLVEFMSVNTGIQVSVHGFADSRGNEKYNMELSLMRANAVASYLKRNNALSGRIDVKAYGEANPVAVNQNHDGSDNPQGRKYNRRVELILDHVPDQLNINKLNIVPLELRIR